MKRRPMARIVASGAVLAACSAVGLPQAEAQSHAPAVRLAAADASSTSMAGYMLTSPPASASASVKFRVPALTCPSTGTYGIALGAFVSTSLGLTGAQVVAECSSGTAVYTAQWWMQGFAVAEFTPSAGDLVETAGSQTATTATALFRDITKHRGPEYESNVGATNSAVLLGMQALVSSGTQLPVPSFGTERFTAGTIDGGTVSASGAVAENMRTSTHVLQIYTGALQSTGKAWREGFRHS
jgi:hypothetical protein